MSRIGTSAGVSALVLGAVVVGAWDAGRATSATSVAPDGRQLFTTKGCSICHTGPDSTTEGFGEFPSLDSAAQWAGDRQPGVSAQDYLAESMVAPDAFISPELQRGRLGQASGMPVLRLTAEEVDSLVSYLLQE